MKRKEIKLLLAFVAASSPLMGGTIIQDPALSEDIGNPSSSILNRGDWLLGFSGSYSRFSASGDDDAGLDVFFFSIDASYFLSEKFSLGLATVGVLVPENDDIDLDSLGFALGLEANARYYFQNSSSVTPFVGIQGGVLWGSVDDDSESIGTYGLHAGLLVELSENVYLDTQVKYNEYEASGVDDFDLNTIQVLVGLKFKF